MTGFESRVSGVSNHCASFLIRLVSYYLGSLAVAQLVGQSLRYTTRDLQLRYVETFQKDKKLL